MPGNIRKYDRFEYYEEDTDCRWCLYYQGKKALYFTQANMAADLLRYEAEAAAIPSGGADVETELAGRISAISEGDTSVSFGGKSAQEQDRERILGDHRKILDGLIFDYRHQLQGFRVVAGW